MTAEPTNQPPSKAVITFTEQFMTEPSVVRRTPAEQARILSRLTLALAAIKNEEGRAHGDA